MPDYSDNGLRAAIKALNDVVAPAVDASNPLAVEQFRLVTLFLDFYASRRPRIRDYQRAELACHMDLARAVANAVAAREPDLHASILVAIETARTAMKEPDIDRLSAAMSDLASLTSQAVHAVAEADDETRRSVERVVVEETAPLLDLKRAWFLPFGFEPAPDERPSLDALLARHGVAPGN